MSEDRDPESRRRRLVALGWQMVLPEGLFDREIRWRSPAGRRLTEEEAFRELEEQEGWCDH